MQTFIKSVLLNYTCSSDCGRVRVLYRHATANLLSVTSRLWFEIKHTLRTFFFSVHINIHNKSLSSYSFSCLFLLDPWQGNLQFSTTGKRNAIFIGLILLAAGLISGKYRTKKIKKLTWSSGWKPLKINLKNKSERNIRETRCKECSKFTAFCAHSDDSSTANVKAAVSDET